MLLATLLLVPSVALHGAELKLASVFADHAILQRDKPVPIWGWADPGEKVTVEFAGTTKTATADANGKWLVKLDPLAASAESREMNVKSEAGARTIHDVLVGEVWLGSGQSNMQMHVPGGVRDFKVEQTAADLPLIRTFTENSAAATTPQPDASGQWLVCSPKTVGSFSAVLYFFGRELHRELKIPVGLIHSSLGATPIEAWTSAEAQGKVLELKETLAKDVPEALQKRYGGPAGLFNGKIAPLIPYAMRGAVWYQGEHNSNPSKSQLYQFQLPVLVNDWRARWGEEFPFAWVQLPSYERGSEGWPFVREAQLKTLRLPKTGMAITVDIGDPKDLHPKNKQEVGRRLSLWVLGEVYGKKVAATSGPLPAGHELRGSEIVLSFTHADGGLKAKDGRLKGFVIAGEDKQFQPAQATIEGDKIVVASDTVKKPVAVRYAWAANPDCNLCNGAGLPASPFRTDDWK